MANAKRVGSIDFWRGAVLIAILVDHIPGNVLEFFTPRNFGLSDSSEAFVFLSGLSVGMVYLPRARKHGLAAVARGCLQRALKLYAVHIALTAAALVIFAGAWWMSGVDDLIEAHGRSFVFGSPATGLPGVALLSHQLGYFNILPLYIVLMLWAPLALAIAMRNPALALAASIADLRRLARVRLSPAELARARRLVFQSLRLAAHVHERGFCAPFSGATGRRAPAPGLVALSLASIAVAALMTTSAAGLAPGLRDAASAHLDLAKQDLGLARVAHFAALAYLAAVAPGLTRVVEGTVGRAVQSLGRNGLAVFAAGSVLSALGQAALGGGLALYVGRG